MATSMSWFEIYDGFGNWEELSIIIDRIADLNKDLSRSRLLVEAREYFITKYLPIEDIMSGYKETPTKVPSKDGE